MNGTSTAKRVAALGVLCAAAAMSADAARPKYPALMELSTRPWLYELSSKYRRNITSLRDIPMDEFARFKKMGMDYIWMMGVWRLGDYGVQHDRNDPSLPPHRTNTSPARAV